MGCLLLIFAFKCHLARILSLLKHSLISFQNRTHQFGILVACCRSFLLFTELSINRFKVFQL